VALNIKLAEAYIDVRVDLGKVGPELGKLKSMLGGLGSVRLGGGAGGGIPAMAGQMVGLNKVVMSGIALQDRLAAAATKAGDAAAKASAKAAQQAARAAQQAAKAPAGMVGLGSLQMSGVKLQTNLAAAAAKASAKAAKDAAKAPAGMVGLGSLQMSGVALQDRLAKAKAQATQAAAADAAKLDAIQDRYVKRDYDRQVRAQVQAQKANDRKFAAAVKTYDAGQKAQRDAGGGGAARGGGGLFGGMGGGASQGAMGLAQGLGIGGLAFSPAQMAGQMIGSGLRESVGTAMELEATFVGLRQVTGESAGNIDKFKNTVFDIAKTQAGVSVADVTGIAMAGAKGGIDTAKLEEFTRSMAKVKNAVGGGEGLDTGALTEDMTRMMYLFGKSTDYIESMGSALVRMANISTASAGTIAQMTKALSGTTAALKLSFPETAAFASVLADAGLTPQQGASSFSQIFRSMASKPETFAPAAGVSTEKWSEMMNAGQLLPGFTLLANKFKEIQAVDPTKAQQWLKGLGFEGVRTAGAFQQVAMLADKIAGRVAMAKEEEAGLGALTAANELKSTTAIANIQKLKNAFEEMADTIGGPLLKHLTEAAKVGLVFANSMLGSKPGGPEPLTRAESRERNFLAFMEERLGVTPGPRLNELNQKAEAYDAYQSGLPLDAKASTLQDKIASLEKSKAGMMPEMAAQTDAAIARLRAQLPPGEVPASEVAARAGRGAMLALPAGQAETERSFPFLAATSGRPAGPMAGLEAPDLGAALGGLTAGAVGAVAERAAEAEAARVAALGGTSGAMLGRRTLASRTAEEVADDATSAEYRRRRTQLAEEREAKRQNFKSEHFAGGDDFARSFIQDMLTERTKGNELPKLQLDEQKQANKFLEQILNNSLSPVKDTIALFSGKA
jgi:TP901 family phage tail tape measure protein